jgi:putative addiction module antidote
MVLTVRRVGNTLAVSLPPEVANALRVGDGDKLYLTPTQDGYRLTPCDPHFAKTMEVAGGVMRRFRNTLRELAKGRSSPPKRVE